MTGSVAVSTALSTLVAPPRGYSVGKIIHSRPTVGDSRFWEDSARPPAAPGTGRNRRHQYPPARCQFLKYASAFVAIESIGGRNGVVR